MSLSTPVTKLLGIERPVLQSPMASAATTELVAAVSAAGGLGALGSAMLPVDDLRAQVQAVRDRTDRPFQLNFFCHPAPEIAPATAARAREYFVPLYDELGLGDPPDPTTPPIAFDGPRLEALLELRPAVVSFHFGLPEPDGLAAIKEAGIVVLSTATTVDEARRLESGGVDAVIAQGAEAGGHRGSFMVEGDVGLVGGLALVPQVVDAVDVPVIAAGGIADPRQLAAALVLGAGAGQVGTGFLRCPESGFSALYKDALGGSAPDGTVVTRAISGRPARVLRNRLTDELDGVLPYPTQMSLALPLREVVRDDDPRAFQPIFAGQSAPLASDAPAAEVVEWLVRGAEELIAGAGRLS